MSSSSGNDELVSQFMAFTGCDDATQASSYLEMSGNNVETAVGLYIEHGGGGGGGGNSAAGAAASMMEDAVRAPDATRRDRLLDDHMPLADPTYHLMNAMMEEQMQTAFAAPMRVDARAAVNAAAEESKQAGMDDDGGDEEAEYNYEDEEEDKEVQMIAGPTPAGLADMFAAPTHLIHSAGGFQGARASARDSRRWLLVNIQRDSEFASHALNRDVWRDELVENLIREGFILWQAVSQVASVRNASRLSRYLLAYSSLTLHRTVERTSNDMRSEISRTLPLSIHERVVCCGARKVGRWKTPSRPKPLPKWPWTFAHAIRLIDRRKRRVLVCRRRRRR